MSDLGTHTDTRSDALQGVSTWWPLLGWGATFAQFLLVTAPVSLNGMGVDPTRIVARIALFAALCVCALLIAALHRKASSLCGLRWPIPVCIALQVAGLVLLQLHIDGLWGDWALTVSFISSGFTLCVLQLMWSEVYASVDRRIGARATASSLAIAAIIILANQLLAAPAAHILRCVLIATPLLLYPASRLVESHTAASPSNLASDARVTPLPHLLGGLFFALAAAYVLPGANELTGFVPSSTMVVSVVVTAFVVGCISILSKGRLDGVRCIVITTLVLAVVYATSGFVMGMFGGQLGALTTIQHCSVLSMCQLLYVFAWTVALAQAREAARCTAAIVARYLVAVYAGMTAGTTVGMLAPLDPAGLSLLALLLFIPAVALLVWHPHGTATTVSDTSVMHTIERRCDDLASTYGLSPREVQVLRLWAAGHNVSYTADALSISKNTVKTHVTHIYKKVGVENREQLIDLLGSSQ